MKDNLLNLIHNRLNRKTDREKEIETDREKEIETDREKEKQTQRKITTDREKDEKYRTQKLNF